MLDAVDAVVMSQPPPRNGGAGADAADNASGTDASGIGRLLAIMARLRDRDFGCPWDREQTFATIVPYTIEEAYEVADAIERADLAALKDELGDLLLQVVFHARMAEEQDAFGFTDVVAAICDKLLRRHPHVFGGAAMRDSAAQTAAWEQHKAQERLDRAAANGPAAAQPAASVLDDVPRTLPALARAVKLQKRAGMIGFDWPSAHEALKKFTEELAELEDAIAAVDAAQIHDEIGDLLFTCANVARKLGIDAEAALRQANQKFERRFKAVEQLLATESQVTEPLSLAALEALWQQVKRRERL
jgi:tetrapyrrole methylase family protein/MazG family protein/ATP diphosphatase